MRSLPLLFYLGWNSLNKAATAEDTRPRHSFISPQHIGVSRTVLAWAKEYLMLENARIKRPYGNQVVCPFVQASVDNKAFYLVFHDEVNGAEPNAIADIILDYVPMFKSARPYADKERINKALLIVFPKLEADHYKALDLCHALIKPDMVENSLMVGQFHPACDTPAVHNSAWREVSRSPVPLIAMRHMAIHDILFLQSDKDWFLQYELQFGQRFRNPEELSEHDKPLVKYYKEARERFSKR